ncbi:hypothetical protein [Flavobacterium sp. ASW18X]|uniref:hypothetical protein n=1 Tax=Flavobacterium sp. ASW18X TaxID=2572595 RepID=UPI0010AE0736|nr:hypothetical protein [Flavobacterium sp. ASW18X]TKD62410.1 hypothetical protein FBT53_09230 [Flavobacterium sp. ASW18X]
MKSLTTLILILVMNTIAFAQTEAKVETKLKPVKLTTTTIRTATPNQTQKVAFIHLFKQTRVLKELTFQPKVVEAKMA